MNESEINALLEEHSKALQELQKVKQENQDLKDCFKSITEGIDAVLTDMDSPIKRLEMVLNDVDAPKSMKNFLITIINATTLNTRTELDVLKGIIKKFEDKNES